MTEFPNILGVRTTPKELNKNMDKLIPMEVSIRQDQSEKKRQKQREQFNQKLVDQQFTGVPATSDKGSAFGDDYISSAYQQVKANDARLKDDLVHATSSAPYHQRRKS